jgi:hypothetical protein
MAQRDSLISENHHGRMAWGTCWSFFPIPIRVCVCVCESGSGDPTAGSAFKAWDPRKRSIGLASVSEIIFLIYNTREYVERRGLIYQCVENYCCRIVCDRLFFFTLSLCSGSGLHVGLPRAFYLHR